MSNDVQNIVILSLSLSLFDFWNQNPNNFHRIFRCCFFFVYETREIFYGLSFFCLWFNYVLPWTLFVKIWHTINQKNHHTNESVFIFAAATGKNSANFTMIHFIQMNKLQHNWKWLQSHSVSLSTQKKQTDTNIMSSLWFEFTVRQKKNRIRDDQIEPKTVSINFVRFGSFFSFKVLWAPSFIVIILPPQFYVPQNIKATLFF